MDNNEDSLTRYLTEHGYHATDERTDTGRVWAKGNDWVLIPRSDNGYYPDEVIEDIKEIVESQKSA